MLAGAAAQPEAMQARAESHGWIAGNALEGGGGVLMHLPPRVTADGTVVGEAGQAWNARLLESVPRAVTGWDRRVYLLYRRDRQWLDVFSLDITRPVPGGAWLTDPAVGASAQPSLDLGEADYVDAAATETGLLVLASAGPVPDAGQDRWSLRQMRDRAWRVVDLPPVIATADRLWLVEGAIPPRLLALTGTSLVVWEWSEDAAGTSARADGGPRADGLWRPSPVALSAEGDEERVAAVFASGADVAWAVRSAAGDRLHLQTLRPDRAVTIATVRLEGVPVAVEPIDGGRRAVIACEIVDPAAEGISKPIRSWQLVEVSMVTGRELFRGPPRLPGLEFGDGIRMLSLGMMAITGFVLFYLLRPSAGDAAIRLPEGWVLAPPGRRIFASLLDAWLVVGVVGVAFGVPFGDFVLVLPLFETAHGVAALGTVMVGGALYGTASEWMLGCTLGKAAARLRVVSVDPSRPTLGLMRCGARNVFRWALAPWALLGLSAPDFRHRGDVVASAAVVMRPGDATDLPRADGQD
ncbi:MAG: RDD family protein [Phycisphaerales bacterium JB054]